MPKAKPLQINMNQGIQAPPLLGTVILKPTAEGKMAYAQHVSVQTDKYGNGVILPGPYLNNFSTSLQAPVYLKGFDSENQKLWFNYDQTAVFDCIKNVDTGSVPALDVTQTVTLTAAAGRVVSDACNSTEYQNAPGTLYVYVTLLNTTGTPGVMAFQSNASQSAFVALSTTTVGGILPILKTQFDGNLYIGNGHKIDRVNPTNGSLAAGTTLSAVGTSSDGAVPPEWFFTALGEWNGQLVGAVCSSPGPTTTPGSIFSERNGSGQSRIYFWDIANNPTGNFKNVFVNSPSHYISVLLTDLSGNLFAFGGVDEGRSTIYQWTGYGFNPIFSYIGDLPRNRHSVCFDAIGRLVWTTANGQVCRYEVSSGIFEHLNSIGASSFGGIATVLQGASNEEFVVSGASASTSAGILSLMSLYRFTGDGAGTDTNGTPIAISGLLDLPQKSIITNVIVSLQKQLISGELLQVRLYKQDGSNTTLGTLDFSADGAVASKQVRSLAYNNDLASIGLVWKANAGSTTAPGVIGIEVEYNQISTL